MSIAQVEAETEVIEVNETVTDADFSYSEHAPRWIWPGVCSVCGRLGHWTTDRAGNFQDPAPRFGADEYLTW